MAESPRRIATKNTKKHEKGKEGKKKSSFARLCLKTSARRGEATSDVDEQV
jgi:hypothetical protein